jgi:hypothetical protein
MEKFIDINKMVFSNTPAENILHYIKTASPQEIRKATPATILRIINECKNGNGEFWIDSDRRAGNNWDSTIEFLYISNDDKPILMLYVQDDKTDTSTSVSYTEFNSCNGYRGSCRLGGFRYDADEVANVIRCILAEYVYYTYIEKADREQAQRIAKLLNYKVVNPVCDYFYKDLRLSNLPFSYATTTPRYKQYCNGKKAIEKYANEHVDELEGKTEEELIAIYKKVFREGM